MSKRTAAIVIALLSWPMLAICQNTVMATWSADSRNMFIALVVLGSAFYVGLDLAIAPETSLWYRINKDIPFTWVTPGFVRIMGVFLILFSLLFGWMFIAQLLGLIK
jgi:hypothetical protein